jgi:NAD(P)H dehydrogenase (quinone)
VKGTIVSDLIAVTGATGALGSLVIDHLLARTSAERVVAIARNPGKATALEAKSVQVRIADHDDRPAVDGALAGIDVLLLISGNEFGKRMVQHENVIRAAQQAGVSRIVPRTRTPAAQASSRSTRPPSGSSVTPA